MLISRPTLVKTAPRLASLAPFWRLIWDHFEWPDIAPDSICWPHDHRRHEAPTKRRACRSFRLGQDHPGRAPAAHRRSDHAAGQGDRGNGQPGLRAGGTEAQAVAL